MKQPRRFNKRQRVAMLMLQGWKCAICGADLQSDWQADHVKAYSKGGDTDIVNGQALCRSCNARKGSK